MSQKTIGNLAFREALPSVNLSLDGREPEEFLENFFLSRKGGMVISSVLTGIFQDRKKRVGTITAPPGSGKSYLALFLGSLLRNRSDWNEIIDTTLKKQDSIHTKRIQREIQEFRNLNETYLPVYLVGEIKDYRRNIFQSIISSLCLEIEEESLHMILLDLFKEEMGIQRQSSSIIKLIDRISNFYSTEESFFEGYKLLIEVIERCGYHGFILIHDEFNRFLIKEQAGYSTDLDFLQDLTEFHLRQKTIKILHYLLLHKGISQYLIGISEDRRKDWLKIEGRFYSFYFQEDIADTYGLISYYIENSGKIKFFKSPLDSKKIQSEILKAFHLNRFLEQEIGKELNEISYKAYPLHISTLIALPLLCNLFGQNERSLYGYLSDLQHRKFSNFIFVPDLFDYFDSSIDQLGLEDRLLSKWIHGRNALSEAQTEIEEDVIKTLTILSIIGKGNLLPANCNWIQFSTFGYSKSNDTKQILESLKRRNLAIYREVTKTYQIHYGSSINLDERILEELPTIRVEDLQSIFETGFTLRPIYARGFNAEYFTSKFYTRHFLLEETISEEIKFLSDSRDLETKTSGTAIAFEMVLKKFLESSQKKGASGVILYYIGSPSSELSKDFKRYFESNTSELLHNFIVFFAKQKIREPELLKKYAVLNLRLSNNRELISTDPRIESDIKLLATDLQDKIQSRINSIFPAELLPTLPRFTKGIPENSDLTVLLSAILRKRFPHYPKINNELINRENITPVIRNSRKKIIRDMLEGDISLGTKERGYGPDVPIFRALFTVKNLFQLKDGKNSFNFNDPRDILGNKDIGLSKIFNVIFQFFDTKSEKHSFDWLYKKLQSEPFGIYSEIIPFYIIGALLSKNYSFSLYEEDRYEKEINSDIVEKIHSTPDKFRIHILRSDRIIDKYLLSIPTIFGKNESQLIRESSAFESKKLSENKVYKAVLSLLYWYTKLPDYTKKTDKLDDIERDWLNLIPTSSNPEDLLLEKIPEIFGVNLENLNDEMLEKLLSKISSSKEKIEYQYKYLIHEIHRKTIKHLKEYISGIPSEKLFDVIGKFQEENSYKIELLRKNDSNFLKLHERIKLKYDNEEAFIDSLSLLLTGLHPKYWKNETINEFEFKLTSELAKLHIAGLMLNPGESAHIKMKRIEEEFKTLSKEEKLILLEKLKKD
ncbi:MAG: hypothetical protein KDK54_21450 [Leptospiraceae bacterium]|nr:hypothetical protein [Leptospiraceae bacterium]